MSKRKRKVTISLPNEFLELCDSDRTEPERVLRQFIADVCEISSWTPRADGYTSTGSDAGSLARDYYDRVDHRKWRREQKNL